MRIREPLTPQATDLGALQFSNRSSLRRRVMAWTVIPLREADGIESGDPVTVLDTGTGQNERAQVEADWLIPYAGGVQRGLRVTFPTVITGSNLRHTVQVRRSASGLLPVFRFRTNVEQGLVALGIRFFIGPKATHYVDLKAQGAPLPDPIYTGTRSRIYRWFARVYQPVQAPLLETQLGLRFDVEVFDDQDYAEFQSKWVCDDPRIDEPNGYLRAPFADDDTEIGIDFILGSGNQNVCQPVPWDVSQSVVSNTWTTDRWRWVQDKRLVYQNQVMNDVLPWGIPGHTEGVLLFKGVSGDLGDQLRNDSCAAWTDWQHPVMGLHTDWIGRGEAYGPLGHVSRRFKRHEHYDMNVDAETVRTRLENEALTLINSGPNGGRAYLWDRGPAACDLFHQGYATGGTGSHGSWQRMPHWPALAYCVPDLGVLAGRFVRGMGAPHAFIEVDGTPVDAFTHDELEIVRLIPGQILGNGDRLGKSADPSWFTSASPWLIRQPVSIGNPPVHGPPMEGTDNAHFEQPWPFVQAGCFGSRSARDVARDLAYCSTLGTWQPTAWNVGRTGQPRAIARGVTMHAWSGWLFGADTRIADRCYDALVTHRIEPQIAAINAALNLPSNRVVRTVSVLAAGSRGPGPDRVDLRLWHYFSPWEDVHGVMGAGINRLMGHQRAELSWFDQYAKDTASDVFRYGSPRIVDADGRVVFTFLRPASAENPPAPSTIYEPGAAVALSANQGLAQLTQQQMSDNNWTLCSFTSGNCPVSNDGHMRLGVPFSGTAAFCQGYTTWVADLEGAAADMHLLRYLPESSTGRFGNPNNVNIGTWLWLTSASKSPTAMQYVWFPPRQTARGFIGFAVSGCAMHSSGTSLWVTTSGQATVRQAIIATGAVTDFQPTLQATWSGVAAWDTSVALLDGADPGLNRTSYRVHVCSEQIVGGGTVSFTLADGVSRDVRGITYDVTSGGWLVCAYRANRSTVWRVPLGGGVATQESGLLLHEDMDLGATSIAVSTDGQLLLVASSTGRVWAYARARGGYWGQPRGQTDRHAQACLGRQARESDALRMVSVDPTGRIVETEV